MLLLDRLILVLMSCESSSCRTQKEEAPMGGNGAKILLAVSPSSSSSLSSLSSLSLFDMEYSRVL